MKKDMILEKQAIRSRYLNYRNSLTLTERKEKSRRIWERLKGLEAYRRTQVILLYMDYRSEVMTTGLAKELFELQKTEDGEKNGAKKIYAPKVEGFDIRFYEIKGMEELEDGYQGIREPRPAVERLFTPKTAGEMECLILVPGAVFDKSGGRMGYGKGFYDRFLAEYSQITSIALAFECQLAKKVPVEEHDQRLNMILTEQSAYLCGNVTNKSL